MKRIVTVQDISCVGKCSLTAALPVISAMGVETCILPTAVLSAHTLFPHPVITDLTDQILPTIRALHLMPSTPDIWQTAVRLIW